MKFDLILLGCAVVGGAVCDIGIKDGLIAEIGRLSGREAGEAIDVGGRPTAPGLIDAHVHIESGLVLPDEFGRAVLAHGTTAVIADPHEIVNVAGAAGLDAFLELAASAPIDVFTVVPSSVPATRYDTNGAGEFSAEDMKKYAARPDVVGLGEVMCFGDVLEGKTHILDKIALFSGKTIDGHTAGLPPEKMGAYAAAGISNDHECVTYRQAKACLEAEMRVYIREGSGARNLEAIVGGMLEDGYDPGRFAFCTDDKHLGDVAREGHIDFNVRSAVRLGMPLSDAVRIASVNPAEFYGLTDRGALEAGKKADIVVFGDERAGSTEIVVKNGVVVINGANNRIKARKTNVKPRIFENTVKFREMSAADFGQTFHAGQIAIGFVENQLLTEKVYMTESQARECCLLAVVERHGRNGNVSACPLLGYGLREGAVATSCSHDSHNVVVAARSAEDAAAACNAVREQGGGYAVVRGGKIVDCLALPAFGLMSELSAEEVTARVRALEEAAREMGVPQGVDPFTTLSFAALPVIPEIRLLDTGLFDVAAGRFIQNV